MRPLDKTALHYIDELEPLIAELRVDGEKKQYTEMIYKAAEISMILDDMLCDGVPIELYEHYQDRKREAML